MNLLQGRTLCQFVLVFLATYFVARSMSLTLAMVVLGCVLLCALLLCFFSCRHIAPVKPLWFLICCGVLVGLLVETYSMKIPQRKLLFIDENIHTYEAEIVRISPFSNGMSAVLDIYEIDENKLNVRMSCVVFGDITLVPGDIVTFEAFARPLDSQNEQDMYALAEGCVGELYDIKPIEIKGHTSSIWAWFASTQNFLARKMQSILPQESGGLYTSLLLGERDYLPSYVTPAFRRLGLSHLLALSGLHITLLAGCLRYLLEKTKASARMKGILCCSFILFYTILTGASSSMLRAATMAIFCSVTWLFGRRNDMLTGLFFALFLLITFSPGAIYDQGLWLSFGATYGVAIYAEWQRQKKKAHPIAEGKVSLGALMIKGLKVSLFLTLFASLFSLPLAIYFFGETSIATIPANLLFGPMIELCMFVAMPVLLFAFVPYVGQAVGAVACIFSDGVLWILKVCNTPAKLTVSMAFPGIATCAILLWAALILIPLLHRHFKRPLSLLSLGLGIVMLIISTVGSISVRFRTAITYYAERGNEYVMLSDRGHTYLVDNSYGNHSSGKMAASFISAHYLTNVDSVVITHIHENQDMYLRMLCSKIKVKYVYVPATMDENPLLLERIEKIANAYNITLLTYQPTEAFALGESEILVWERFSAEEGRDAFGFSIQSHDTTFCLASSDYTKTPPSQTVLAHLLEANVYVVSSHEGMRQKPGPLPVTDSLQHIILPNKNIPLLWNNQEDNQDILSRLICDNLFYFDLD